MVFLSVNKIRTGFSSPGGTTGLPTAARFLLRGRIGEGDQELRETKAAVRSAKLGERYIYTRIIPRHFCGIQERFDSSLTRN